MTVSKELSPLEHSSVKLTLTVGKDDVRSEYDKVLEKYRKTIQIPGFRKGKAPSELLVRKFGDALKGEALGTIIEKSVTEVFEDEALSRAERPLPYSTPQVQEEPELDLDRDLRFSVVYDVLPTVTVGQWKGLKAEAPHVRITDADFQRELEALRDRNAFVMDRDEGAAAETGNVVTVNYCELDGDGAVILGSERQDFVFTLGSGHNVFKFDDEVTGMKQGETRDIEKSYPADFSDADLAGKTKKIRVSLTALKEKKLPILNDDFAQDVSEKFQTLDDLKNNIRERLDKNLEKRLRDIKISKILEKIMENTPVDIPESMIRLELESRWRNFSRRLGVPLDEAIKLMEKSGKSMEEIQNNWRADAIKSLHSRLIVETLLEELGMTASDEEMDQELETVARESDSPLEEVKKYYSREHMMDYLREDIGERKLFDLLLAENTIKMGEKANYLDIMGNNG